MKKIVLQGTHLKLPRFIFGTASLYSVGSRKDRLRLLSAAIDLGFTHFDTAPYYGFGMSEQDLSFILARDASISVTSKVGLYSPGGEGQNSLKIFLRKVGGRIYPKLSRPIVNYSIQMAKTSLEGSLRRLRRSQIELFMLHDPIWELLNTDEWLKWLESEVVSGRVGQFGLALTAEKLKPFLINKSPLADVIQVLDSLDLREADILNSYGKDMQITYGYVSASHSRNQNIPVCSVLKKALERNRCGAIIVSTKNIKRLDQYANVLAELDG